MSDKTNIYTIDVDTRKALEKLKRLQKAMDGTEKSSKAGGDAGFKKLQKSIQGTSDAALKARAKIEKLMKVSSSAAAASSTRVAAATAKEKAAREALTAAISRYGKVSRSAGKTAAASMRNIETITNRSAKAARKLAVAGERARNSMRNSFLGIGQYSRSSMGQFIRYMTGGAIALTSFNNALIAMGKIKTESFNFDDLTTATLSIAKSGEHFFEYGQLGAQEFREAIRGAANELKVSAADMSQGALFWAKAGEKNTESIVELSKVGTMFAKANRNAEGNVLGIARSNDILSDALRLFRKDVGTPEKAFIEAQALGDKLTMAANASNHSVEQLWEFSKKVAPLAKSAGFSDSHIMAIAGSLAASGLKAEEPGRLVRRIMTRMAMPGVQEILKDEGVSLTDKEGNIKSFTEIFGGIQESLKRQKPLERLAFMKELFGQNAISVASALAGLNEKTGKETGYSVDALMKTIDSAEGMMHRNREQQLRTFKGRTEALSATWGNKIEEALENSKFISQILAGLERIDIGKVFEWIDEKATPALEKFGYTFHEVIVPALHLTYTEISEFLSPATKLISSLFGGLKTDAKGLSTVLSFLIKSWIRYKAVLMAIKVMRIGQWFADLATKMGTAAAAATNLGASTQAGVGVAKTALTGLSRAFGIAGMAIATAIAGWQIYESLKVAVIDPMVKTMNIVNRVRDLAKSGALQVGDETTENLKKTLDDRNAAIAARKKAAYGVTTMGGVSVRPRVSEKEKAEIAKLERERDLIETRYQQQKAHEDQIAAFHEDVKGYGKRSKISKRNVWSAHSKMKAAQQEYAAAPTKENDMKRRMSEQLYREQLVESRKAEQASVDRMSKDIERSGKYMQGAETGKALDEAGKADDELRVQYEASLQRLQSIDDKIAMLDANNESRHDRAGRRTVKAEVTDKKDKRGPLDKLLFPWLMKKQGDIARTNISFADKQMADYFAKNPELKRLVEGRVEKTKGIKNLEFNYGGISIEYSGDISDRGVLKRVEKEFMRVFKDASKAMIMEAENTVPGVI